MFFCNKRPLGCHVSACVLTSMAFIKTNSLSQINITMFSKLCWPFLNSEIIFSLLDTHKNISKINVPLQLLSIAHTYADSSDLMETMIFFWSVHLLVKAGKEFGKWSLGTWIQLLHSLSKERDMKKRKKRVRNWRRKEGRKASQFLINDFLPPNSCF